MLHSTFRLFRPLVGVVAVGLACVPALAGAEEMATMHAERTAAYDVVLTIDPPVSDSGPSMDMSGDHAAGMAMSHDSGMMMHNDAGMMMHDTDQGMAVNHWLDVHVTQADAGTVVSDLTPTIRITDKTTGISRDLPGVMGVTGGMSGTDFHYGQNVFLPDGSYEVTVQLGPGNTAIFRDVMVVASTMMMGH
jgi:hypothetical protein